MGTETFHLTTPEVHLQTLKVLGKIISKVESAKVVIIIPGVSSVATKVLGGDFKASEKIKIEFIEIWIGNMLTKYF